MQNENAWKPHPKQEEALKRIEFEILYGGARGGGKTDAGLVWLTDYIDNPRFRALVIRKNADDLSDWVDRASRFYRGLGANIAYRPPIITFPSGAIIRTGHLKDDQAYTKYQGQEFHRILVEELTQIPTEKRYLQLIASCRSTIKELVPQVFNTTNPGGIGHGWVKGRFVDVAPPNTPYLDPISGQSRIYIPATIDDNPSLTENDPAYVRQLDALKGTDVELWKAWRMGDWDTFAGQFFKEFNLSKHVIKYYFPFKSNVLVGGLDWGRTDPFSTHFTEIKAVEFEGKKFFRATTFAEVYGTDKMPREWGEIIKTELDNFNLTLKDVSWIRCDNQIYNPQLDTSKSIFDQFVECDEGYRTLLKPASKERIGGWENMHNWLSIAPDGLPYWQITENCHNLIRTLPALVHDENKVEDVDQSGEDHAPDDQRYQFKHLKWIDAKVGGIMHTSPTTTISRTAEFVGTKQVSIDITGFEDPHNQTNEGGLGGVIHN
jgi:phage terminase large subunit